MTFQGTIAKLHDVDDWDKNFKKIEILLPLVVKVSAQLTMEAKDQTSEKLRSVILSQGYAQPAVKLHAMIWDAELTEMQIYKRPSVSCLAAIHCWCFVPLMNRTFYILPDTDLSGEVWEETVESLRKLCSLDGVKFSIEN